MTYRTTCPQCNSVFRLLADQLDAAQGWVQCSVCGAAFDAHPTLLMEDGSPLVLPLNEPEPLDQPPAPKIPPSTPHETPTATIDTPPPAETRTEATPPPESQAPRGITQRETSLDLPSIILIDPEIPASDDPGPLPQIYPPSSKRRVQATPAPPVAPVVSATTSPFRARIEYATPAPRKARIPSVRWQIPTWVWSIASILLLALLFMQSAFFLRNTLVSQFPQTRPALEQTCAMAGCTLSLPKNLSLLQIVGSDLETEASGRLILTLTLGNRAGHAQTWPTLVLTLSDQRNRPLARRSFAPSEYLSDMQRIAAGIPPRSEQALILPLTVHDLAPMGFELKLTY